MKVGNVGSIPVVEDEQNRKLVGIVTDRDLALHIVAEGRDAKSTKVGAVMTANVVTCQADDDLQKALDAMAAHQLRRIPVVDGANKLVGIIAQADVATRAQSAGKDRRSGQGNLTGQPQVKRHPAGTQSAHTGETICPAQD